MKLLNRLLRRCSHRLSWPRMNGDGKHYQTCLICGASFAYDWERMQRMGLLKATSANS